MSAVTIIGACVAALIGYVVGWARHSRRTVANPHDTDLLDAMEAYRWGVEAYRGRDGGYAWWQCGDERGDTLRIAIRRRIAVQIARNAAEKDTEARP